MTSSRGRRRGRVFAITFLTLVAGSTLLGAPAHSQVETGTVETTLAGYQGRAITSGLHAFYNPEGLLPTAPPGDFGVPDALATISSGPSTFARASVADPGDLLANPEALLGSASSDYPTGTVPAYPYRVSATSGFGEPEAESNAAPGLHASVEARADNSRARSSTPAALAPGVFTAGSIRSEATTKLEGSSITVRARTEMSGFSLLDIVKIESVVTDVTATSDGGETKLSGGTTITGATVMDQPVIIDAEGVRNDPEAEPSGPGLGALTGPLNEDMGKQLADAGIRISAAGPVAQSGGDGGQLSTTGLRIDIEISERTFPLLSQLADLVPSIDNPIPDAPASIDDALQLIRAKHVVAFEIGRAAVALTARPATPIDESVFDDSGLASAGGDFGLSSIPTPSMSGGSALPVAGPTSAVPMPESTPAASVGAGIGALALLSLLVQPFFGDRLARAAATVLGTGAADDVCLREER